MSIDEASSGTVPVAEQLSSAMAELQMEQKGQSDAGGETMAEEGANAERGDAPQEEDRSLVLVTVRIPRQAFNHVFPIRARCSSGTHRVVNPCLARKEG